MTEAAAEARLKELGIAIIEEQPSTDGGYYNIKGKHLDSGNEFDGQGEGRLNALNALIIASRATA